MLPFKNNVQSDISAIFSLILIKFAATMHISHWFPGQCIHRGMTPQKVSVSFYYLPKNSEKSANNRFRAKLMKYSNFYDIFADVWPILMEYCMMTHLSYPEHNCGSKVKFKKIQDGGCCRLKTMSKAISQQSFHWFW